MNSAMGPLSFVRWSDQPAASAGWERLTAKGVNIIPEGPEGANKKASSDMRIRRGVRGTRSYLSRSDRVGVSTSIARGATGCCGFTGPYPSATLDKILTKLSE